MARKFRHGEPDENFIHDERSVDFLNLGIDVSYVSLFKSLSKRFETMRRFLAPSKGRLNERWVENALVLRALPPAPARVLDLGGATSPMPLTLAMLGYPTTIVDLRPSSFRHPNLSTIVGDVRTVRGLQPPYDVVYAISVIEHAGLARYGEPEKASESGELVRRMAELAAPGALLLITVPFGEAHVPKIGDRSTETGKPTGFKVFDRAMLTDLTRGLSVEELSTFGLKDGLWLSLPPEEVEKIPLRHYATGVAFLRLRKP
ncbi:MAG TPA: methyltransferase domain-containing protein [Planctomycetota bacterium]|nr:methyltransferase domain-containing protein [Planctomycetota bacterium]